MFIHSQVDVCPTKRWRTEDPQSKTFYCYCRHHYNCMQTKAYLNMCGSSRSCVDTASVSQRSSNSVPLPDLEGTSRNHQKEDETPLLWLWACEVCSDCHQPLHTQDITQRVLFATRNTDKSSTLWSLQSVAWWKAPWHGTLTFHYCVDVHRHFSKLSFTSPKSDTCKGCDTFNILMKDQTMDEDKSRVV